MKKSLTSSPYSTHEAVVRTDITERGKDIESVLLDCITSAWERA